MTEDSNSSSQRYKKQKDKIDCKITKKPGQGHNRKKGTKAEMRKSAPGTKVIAWSLPKDQKGRNVLQNHSETGTIHCR